MRVFLPISVSMEGMHGLSDAIYCISNEQGPISKYSNSKHAIYLHHAETSRDGESDVYIGAHYVGLTVIRKPRIHVKNSRMIGSMKAAEAWSAANVGLKDIIGHITKRLCLFADVAASSILQ